MPVTTEVAAASELTVPGNSSASRCIRPLRNAGNTAEITSSRPITAVAEPMIFGTAEERGSRR